MIGGETRKEKEEPKSACKSARGMVGRGLAELARRAGGTLSIPPIIHVGGGAVSRAPEVLRSLGCKRPLVVTDAFMRSSGLLKRLTDGLEQEGMGYAVFDGVLPDPTTDIVDAGLAASHKSGADAVLGFGGGSSIDTAKAIAVLAQHGGPMANFKAPAQAPVGLPVIAAPTTAGTGSEVTRFAIITDTARDEKMLCMGPGMLPAAALVDHQLTHACPYRLTMDSGLDALCHALEAYVSRKANAHADVYALEALRAIPTNLRAVNGEQTRVHVLACARRAHQPQ